MNKIKLRIVMLSLLLISILTITTIHIYGEVSKVEKVSSNYKDKLIRFHILANSDSEEDQELKLKVRDEVIKYLQPLLKNSKSIEESEKIIKEENQNITNISKNIIEENGYNYEVKVNLEYSNFPAKQYSNIVLPAGEYKSIRIIIGDGEGQNWWCVMFPPLCFVDENNGVIDKETDEKLKDILTEEEYDLISGENSEKASNRKMKFKLLEILESIKDEFK